MLKAIELVFSRVVRLIVIDFVSKNLENVSRRYVPVIRKIITFKYLSHN